MGIQRAYDAYIPGHFTRVIRAYLPGHMSLHPGLCRVSVVKSLVFFEVFWRLFLSFCPFYFWFYSFRLSLCWFQSFLALRNSLVM